jgi:hypothetical protein
MSSELFPAPSIALDHAQNCFALLTCFLGIIGDASDGCANLSISG